MGPISTPGPLVKPEKTGKPTKPNKRYNAQLKVPNWAPKRQVVNKMPNSPSEIGTGLIGIAMHNGPNMQVTEVIKPAIASLLVDIL